MIRWAYLIPRIIIVGLIVLAAWISIDPLVRYVVVNNLENAVGAKVEIKHLRFSWSNQKLFLKEIEIADPKSPMRNLVQAEIAYLDFNLANLWNRKFVIEHGQSNGVKFGSPRTDNGAIPGFPILSPEDNRWSPQAFSSIEELGVRWLDQLQPIDSPKRIGTHQHLQQATASLEQFWNRELQNQYQQISLLQSKRAELMSATTTSNETPNPLRQKKINYHAHAKTLDLNTKAINSKLDRLLLTVESNRAAIRHAHQQDLQALAQSSPVSGFDGQTLSKLLLTQSQESNIAETINLFHWFRSTIPDPKTDFLPKHYRGVDIDFGAAATEPSFLIKSFEFEGETHFLGQYMDFAGTAKNLTSEPLKHDQPAVFELRAQGEQHVVVDCTLDRRDTVPVDRLRIKCPNITFAAQTLGEPNSLLVSMAQPKKVQVEIELTAHGEVLSGDIVMRHSGVLMHVDQIHELAGGQNTADQINTNLASLNQFETRVKLSGTFDDYQYEFESDLGEQLASQMSTSLTQRSKQIASQNRQSLDQALAVELEKLDKVLPQLQRLKQMLQAESAQIASLRDAISEQDRLNNFR